MALLTNTAIKECTLLFQRHSIECVPRTTPFVSFLWISSFWCKKSNGCFPQAQRYFWTHDFSFLLYGSIIDFYNQFLFSLPFLGPIYTVRFLSIATSLRRAYNSLTIVVYVRKKCRSILKHVSKHCDNRKSCGTLVACDKKSYRVNPPLLRDAVNLLWGANRLNKSENNIRKVHCLMLRLLQVNEQGHIPSGKKRAFILTNETRLLALIWIILGNMTDLRTASKCPENNRHSARWSSLTKGASQLKASHHVIVTLLVTVWPDFHGSLLATASTLVELTL